MAYTKQTSIHPQTTGVAAAPTAPAGAGIGNGDAITPGSWILVNNASGAPITITLGISRTHLGYAITPPTVSVPATTVMAIGPLPADPFQQLSGANAGFCLVDYSSITTVTRTVFATV